MFRKCASNEWTSDSKPRGEVGGERDIDHVSDLETRTFRFTKEEVSGHSRVKSSAARGIRGEDRYEKRTKTLYHANDDPN